MASMALGVTPGVALAQSSPTNPVVSSAASAHAAVAKEVSGMDIPRKGDGSIDFDQWFKGKNEKEKADMADQLSDRKDLKDFTKYIRNEWRELDKETMRLDNINNLKKTEWKELDATIIALNTIESFQNKLKTGSTLTPEERRQLESAINTPGVSEMVRKWMQKYI